MSIAAELGQYILQTHNSASEMTYIVSSGALNSTHSLIQKIPKIQWGGLNHPNPPSSEYASEGGRHLPMCLPITVMLSEDKPKPLLAAQRKFPTSSTPTR